jgi:SAM-dependent methyltransferase
VIRRHKRSAGRTLLDVACGTGGHLAFLKRDYVVEGLDREPRLLAIARRKLPGVRFHRGDMARFSLGRRFDVVTCLFSAIGYMATRGRLRRAMANMARHLLPGGVLIIEPWLTPGAFQAGYTMGQFVEQPGVVIARFSASRRGGGQSVVQFHYLVAGRGRITHFTERHRLGLFTFPQYGAALRSAGLTVTVDRIGLIGRGLLIGVAPIERESAG